MPRKILSRSAIVAAAFELLGEGGLASITARSLAAKLGVQPGALYYHVKDMDALADDMATEITRALVRSGPVPEGIGWEEFIRMSMGHMRGVLLSYREGARLFAGTYLNDDEILGSMEVPLDILTKAGFALPEAVAAWFVAYNYTVGFVIEEQQRQSGPGVPDERYQAQRRKERVDPERFPLTHEASTSMMGPAEPQFAFGLDTIILGLRARLGAPAS